MHDTDDVLSRLFGLGEAVENSVAEKSLLAALDSCNFDVSLEQLKALRMVRASILKSLILGIMSSLEKKGADKQSIGQVLHMLKSDKIKPFFLSKHLDGKSFEERLAEISLRYEQVLQSKSNMSVRELRDCKIAHFLNKDRKHAESEYEDVFKLHDDVREIIESLFEITNRGTAPFKDTELEIKYSAKLFCSTYAKGLGDKETGQNIL